MSKLTIESARKIIAHNREVIYHLPKKCKHLNEYLTGSLRQTFFSVLRFVNSKQIIIADHKYIFFADNKMLTHGARRKMYGEATTSRHMNLLCAIGLFNKQEQDEYKGKLIEVNRNFFKSVPDRVRPINVYSFRKYTDQELDRLEERATRLHAAGVTPGNFSYNMLVLHGLQDLAEEVMPANNPNAPAVKEREYNELMVVLETLVEEYGFTTKEQIRDNLIISNRELEKLFRIFRNDIKDLYYYKRPTNEQKEKWELQSDHFIYTKKRIIDGKTEENEGERI